MLGCVWVFVHVFRVGGDVFCCVVVPVSGVGVVGD